MMLIILSHFGVTVGAITGALGARGKKIDLFGVMVLGVAMALGGGTLRDLLLDDTPFWMRRSDYLLNALGTSAIAFFVARLVVLSRNILLIADALVLAAFTMIGTMKGLAFGTGGTTAVILGGITGVVGGILRDLLTGEIPLVFRPSTTLYATAALAGGALFTTLRQIGVHDSAAVIAGGATVFLLRLAGIRWHIGLPVFHDRESRPPRAG